jgi:hypothetical protein
MTDYCDTSDVKAWMGLTDSNLDALIATVLPAASRWIDGRCHRPSGFGISAATARYYDVGNDGLIWTDDIADPSTVAIATDTAGNGTFSTAWTSTDYQLLPLNAPAGWPEARPYWQIHPINNGLAFPRFTSSQRTGLVRVTAKWGWPEVPAAVKLATIMQTARLTQRRTSPQGVAGFNDFGVVRVSVTDADIDELLSDFMLLTCA